MDTVLLEREYAGLKVEIHYGRKTKKLALCVQEGLNAPIVKALEPDSVFDAFNHPYLYVSRLECELAAGIDN